MNALTKDFTDAVEKQFSALNADVKDALEKARVTEAIVTELEQKMSTRAHYASNGPSREESWGDQFIESDGLKAFADVRESRPARFRMDIKTTILSGSTSGGPLGLPAYQDGTNNLPQRRLRVRSLLPTVSISTGAVEYPKQTTRTNNAAPVAEGELKPESALAWTMETVTPKVIAHWIPASVQILEDAPQLRDTIDTELRYGLALEEDDQLLNGDGTGENIDGLIANATAYAAPFDPAGTETMIDQVALAMLQTTLADYVPTGIIMHPSDWMRIRLLKDADGKYLLGAPGADVPQVLHGLPVVTTSSIAIDSFLVGDFTRAATLYDRWTPRVEISTEHADFFTRNLVAIRAEERIALAAKNALALTVGDFGNVT